MPDYDPNSGRYDFETAISIADIREYFKKHNNTGPYFSMFETGLGGNRFDLIRVDPYRQYVRIFEFKSSRRDFISDKKWQNYLKYCHTFTFVCPRGVISKEELLPNIGLMWVYKWGHKSREARMLTADWIKKPKVRDVSEKVLTRLAFMLVYRTIWRKADVF